MHIFITGGTSRLGSSLVRNLSKQGHRITFSYFTSEAGAKKLASETSAQAHYLDLANLTPTEAERVFGGDLPPVDAIINNSSVFEYDKPGAMTFDLLDRCYQVNLKAPLLLLEAFVKNAVTRNTVAINILDAKVQSTNPDYASYTLMKHALQSATSLYAMQFAHSGLKVYGVAPAMFAESGPLTTGKVAELSSFNPLKYELTQKDVCQAVEFLLSGTLQTGETIVVDAGQTLLKLPRDVAYLT